MHIVHPDPIDLLQHDGAIRCGDIILVGKTDPISRAIQHFSHSTVSHSLVALNAEEAWDAMDQPGNLAETHGGARPVELKRYLNGSALTTIALLRPTAGPLHEAALKEAIAQVSEPEAPFATLGVWLDALLLIASTRIIRRTAETLHLDQRLDKMLGVYAEAIADGPARLVCGEFVTRVYANSGIELSFTDSMLMKHFSQLRTTPAQTPSGITLEQADEHLKAVRLAIENNKPSNKTILHRLHYGTWDAVHQFITRLHEDTPGERIDLITPSDFYHCPQLRTVTKIQRDDSSGPWMIL
jgi:hypothetical protein